MKHVFDKNFLFIFESIATTISLSFSFFFLKLCHKNLKRENLYNWNNECIWVACARASERQMCCYLILLNTYNMYPMMAMAMCILLLPFMNWEAKRYIECCTQFCRLHLGISHNFNDSFEMLNINGCEPNAITHTF